MADPRTDQIAREAARLIAIGRAEAIEPAIRMAADSLGFQTAPYPSSGRVRKHAQAMSMQALGEAGYIDVRRNMWRIAEELLAMLEHAFPEGKALLTGRAAAGHIDIGVRVHVRFYTSASIPEIAQALVDFGYDEPQFQTAETRHGRLSRILLVEANVEIVITRCMPELAFTTANTDLFTGKPIETLDLTGLRQRLQELDAKA